MGCDRQQNGVTSTLQGLHTRPVDDVISGLPDGAQIVVRTFFYLYIKFEAELYAYWLCRLCLSKLFIFWLFIAPIFAHPLPLLHTPFRDRKTQNWKVAGLYKGENPDGKRLIGKKLKKHAFLRAWVPQDPGGHLWVNLPVCYTTFKISYFWSYLVIFPYTSACLKWPIAT